MKHLCRLLPVALLVLLMAAPACSLRGPEKIRREISRSTGTEYSKEIGITLGRVGLAVARMALDEEDEELKVLENLTKIRVGVYQVKSRPENPGEMDLGRVAMACIGPVTEKTLVKNGLTARVVPERYTIPDLVEAILAYYGAQDGVQ